MQPKILNRGTLPLLVLAAFAFSLAFLSYFIHKIPSALAQKTPDEESEPASGGNPAPRQEDSTGKVLPLRIKIPSIKVDAAIETVGLTAEGTVGAPSGPQNAAWLNLGPLPGEGGSAVISGHYGWKDGIRAAFDNLKEINPGDKIYVLDERGETNTFVVREVRSFGEKEDAALVFTSNDGKSHLNLITCEGVWNKEEKSYSKRLVVFADRETE